MYSLDINFLRERQRQDEPADLPSTGTASTLEATPQNRTPIFIGAAAGLVLPLAVLGLWFWLGQQTQQLQGDIAALNQELEELGAAEARIQATQEELARARTEAEALAGVFTRVKPVSAVLEDLRDRIPPRAEITSVVTRNVVAANNNTADANASASEPAAVEMTISGHTASYEDANYFVLTLKQSEFFESDSVRLTGVNRVSFPRTLDGESFPENFEPTEVIAYTIEARLSDRSAIEILPTLTDKGAVGYVRRIGRLIERGLI